MTISVKTKGIAATLLLSVLVLFFFFGKSILRLNQTFFNPDGDGIQAYYTALYHVNHDTSYWRMNGMNYPNGEQVFFTGCQPVVTNSIKAISQIVDIKPYTIGILNGIMLLSVVLCALFLYLIFQKLDIPLWIAVPAAVLMAFASPQINRLNGHYSLTYQFAIPAFIYLMMCFQEVKNVRISLWIMLFVLFLTAVQFYFFGFILLIAVLWWLFYLLLKQDDNRSFLKKMGFAAAHFTFQIIIPFLLIQLLVKAIDPVTDRTASPWGFFVYKSLPQAILYPYGLWYETLLLRGWLKPNLNFEWEGVAYVGIIGLFAASTGIVYFFRSLFQIKQKRFLLPFTDSIMNVIFYASLIGFFVAIALPFSLFDNFLYNHIGYFKQLRGIGRFAWVTYYGLGIIGIYIINRWMKKNSLFAIIPIVLLSINATEAYRMSSLVSEAINSQPDYWTQKKKHPNYSWINNIQTEEYQAIIPLPYFHIGSENIWIQPEGNIYQYAFMSSFYSGLPLTSVLLNRNSLSDTYDHLRIIQEPSGDEAEFISRMNQKPYLILVDKQAPMNRYETEMIQSPMAIRKFENESVKVLEIPVAYFKERSQTLRNKMNGLKKENYFTKDDTIYQTSQFRFVYYNPENKEEVLKKRYIKFFDGIIPIQEDSLEMTFSVQILNFYTDLIPRSLFQLNIGDDGKESESYYPFNKHLISTRDRKGLVEFSFMYHKNKRIQIHAVNYEVTDKRPLQYKSVFLKPAKDTVWFRTPKHIWVNNRLFETIN
jgi:hypothetical protein